MGSQPNLQNYQKTKKDTIWYLFQKIGNFFQKELETLRGYVKQAIFQEQDPKEAMKHINLAHQILKTLVACNAINAEQDVVDITPQNTKALEDK